MNETSVQNEFINAIDNGSSSPVNLGQAPRDKTSQTFDKAAFNKGLEERKSVINDEAWERLILVSKLCYMRDKDADVYDVFDFIRTEMLGGWKYTSQQVAKIDAEIEAEENGLRRTR